MEEAARRGRCEGGEVGGGGGQAGAKKAARVSHARQRARGAVDPRPAQARWHGMLCGVGRARAACASARAAARAARRGSAAAVSIQPRAAPGEAGTQARSSASGGRRAPAAGYVRQHVAQRAGAAPRQRRGQWRRAGGERAAARRRSASARAVQRRGRAARYSRQARYARAAAPRAAAKLWRGAALCLSIGGGEEEAQGARGQRCGHVCVSACLPVPSVTGRGCQRDEGSGEGLQWQARRRSACRGEAVQCVQVGSAAGAAGVGCVREVQWCRRSGAG